MELESRQEGPRFPTGAGSYPSPRLDPRNRRGGLHWEVGQGAPRAEGMPPRHAVRPVGCCGVNWAEAPGFDPGLGLGGDWAGTGQPRAAVGPRTPGFGAPFGEWAGLCCDRGFGYPGT